MIFDKPSTRTRVSFDVGMRQLGGETIMLTGTEMQLGRSETIADTAKVLSRYVDAIMIRTTSHERLLELTENATVPVINGLTDETHPCQLMADMMTFEEHRGPVTARPSPGPATATMCCIPGSKPRRGSASSSTWRCPRAASRAEAYRVVARRMAASSASPARPRKRWTGPTASLRIAGCRWARSIARAATTSFCPTRSMQELMRRAKPEALFMHCLPAHRGEEVTDEVIDGPHSVVFDEAENRLHAQKAVLAWCLGAGGGRLIRPPLLPICRGCIPCEST